MLDVCPAWEFPWQHDASALVWQGTDQAKAGRRAWDHIGVESPWHWERRAWTGVSVFREADAPNVAGEAKSPPRLVTCRAGLREPASGERAGHGMG